MKLGFLTVALGPLPLEKKAEWAASQGFQALEIACWPRTNDRDYAASDLDVVDLTKQDADGIRAMMDRHGLEISSLAYYDNNLDRDPVRRAFVNAHVRKVVDAAALLGVERVGTFVGRNIDRSIAANFDAFETVFTGLAAYAEDRGVKLMIENCPMVGWQKPGEPGTISFSPELWAEMFRRVPAQNFGLNLDPSHLVFLRIDYLPLVDRFSDRIFHVHAKDMMVFEDRFRHFGVFNRQLWDRAPETGGFERPRMPGLGLVDWRAFLCRLRDAGYDGYVSIEHEDPDYEGTEAKVKEGLRLGYAHLVQAGGGFFGK
jgi:sugar phosphate isomerase/epimerase